MDRKAYWSYSNTMTHVELSMVSVSADIAAEDYRVSLRASF